MPLDFPHQIPSILFLFLTYLFKKSRFHADRKAWNVSTVLIKNQYMVELFSDLILTEIFFSSNIDGSIDQLKPLCLALILGVVLQEELRWVKQPTVQYNTHQFLDLELLTLPLFFGNKQQQHVLD